MNNVENDFDHVLTTAGVYTSFAYCVANVQFTGNDNFEEIV